MQRRLGLFILAILIQSGAVFAQHQITGRIADANTAEPLPAAHIIIKGTYKGTIANADGEFNITVNTLPATLVARFLGYETKEIEIPVGHEGPVDFLMEEAFLEMEEIVVTGEDPAISIMREVIERKKVWRKNLQTYQVDAYTRQQMKTDTSIASISESISQAFWDKERGSREVIKSQRQTANMGDDMNFAGVSYLPNLYDDNLEVAGFDVLGVSNPKALDYYDFKLVDFSKIDDQLVFEIEVKSKRKLQPLFEGTIHVLDEDYAIIDVKLKPNSVVVFPKPIQEFDMYYEQQFSNFGGEYWLPVDFRMEGNIEFGVPGLRFPPIGFSQISKLNDYQVNVSLPDSLYKEDGDWMMIDTASVQKSDSLFSVTMDVVPLSKVELEAYETIDSTATFEKAFKPKGFLVRFIDWDEGGDGDNVETSSGGTTISSGGNSKKKGDGPIEKFVGNLSLDARYNRVDAVFGGLKHERRYADRRIRSRAKVGYSTGYEEFNHGVDVSFWPLKKTRRFAFLVGYEFTTDTRYSSDLFDMTLMSAMPLLGYDDYFDYYRREGGFLKAVYLPRGFYGTSISAKYNYEEQTSIDYKTSYDILASSLIQRINPPIQDGTLSSLEIQLERGEGKEAFGIIGANNMKLNIEQSLKAMGSDWNFTRFNMEIYQRFSTFYKRRFIPNALDLRLNAGTYLGSLPVQKNGTLDAALGGFTPFGAFKSQQYLPYEGASYIALNAEHNFRSVPLELLGIPNVAKSGLSVIVFGGAGKTWIPSEQEAFFNLNLGRLPNITGDTIHSEVGVSLSNIFSLFRIDLAYRIDEPGFYPGISVARMF